MLDLLGSFQITIEGKAFFEEPVLPIAEFLYFASKWRKRFIKTFDLNYISIETEQNPLISFRFVNGKWKIFSPWQKFEFDAQFERKEIEAAFDALTKQVKAQFQLE